MYELRLIWVGKTQETYLKDGIHLYLKKLKPYVTLNVVEIKATNYRSEDFLKFQRQETEKILERLSPSETNIFFDESGQEMTSLEFSRTLGNLRECEHKRVNFITGGAFGFEKAMLPKGARLVSLSKMTMTHQMVRLLLLEQTYRAFTLIHGQKYHHA